MDMQRMWKNMIHKANKTQYNMHADISHTKQHQLKWKPKPLGVERIYQIRKDTIWGKCK